MMPINLPNSIHHVLTIPSYMSIFYLIYLVIQIFVKNLNSQAVVKFMAQNVRFDEGNFKRREIINIEKS